MNRLLLSMTSMIFLIILILPITAFAQNTGVVQMKKATVLVDKALKYAQEDRVSESQHQYNQFKKQWFKIEDTVKLDSSAAYKAIEKTMGQVDYSYLQNQHSTIVSSLIGLQKVNDNYINGKYAQGETLKNKTISLNDFIHMLSITKDKTDAHNQTAALDEMKKVRESWLNIEGKVVSKSSSLYNRTERDMVLVNAMIQNQQYEQASHLIKKMVSDLSPLATTNGYSIWDAAMIPIREGLEALLVVGALLTFIKKANSGRGKAWIWSGVSIGLGLSAILAVMVKVVFNSGAFGNNNFIITGITSLSAAAMLIYMSYWLHSKSNIAEWNRYIRAKSQAALTSGSLMSLGILSFLAVFREGTETVLFIIGMAKQISLQNLLMGLVVGLGILVMFAILMLVIGVKLPIRPFFIVSSLIVFYLSLKFTGLGIHSLQLAGFMPTTLAPHLPTIELIAFFPTLQSAIPQLILVLSALIIYLWKRRTMKIHKK